MLRGESLLRTVMNGSILGKKEKMTKEDASGLDDEKKVGSHIKPMQKSKKRQGIERNGNNRALNLSQDREPNDEHPSALLSLFEGTAIQMRSYNKLIVSNHPNVINGLA